jgi:hypothetical protein
MSSFTRVVDAFDCIPHNNQQVVMLLPQAMAIVGMGIQVGGAREGQSFVMKVQHPNFGQLLYYI